jgi:16S rRNA (adenine1518-N6/adenine1519-N6)-dimethyltransferase
MKNLPDNFHFSKARGQNFLVDLTIPKRIAELSGISGKNVLEIGPGMGALTLELAKLAERVLCVEVDRQLIEPLRNILRDNGADNVTVVNLDALKIDINSLIDEHFGYDCRPVVCANLPYAITTPILSKLIESKRFDALTVMVQLEVAERICAKPGTKDYGAFSVFAQYYTEPKILFSVPPTAFVPRPKVTSAVARLAMRLPVLAEDCEGSDEKKLFRVVKASFAQRRKTMVNALSAGLNLPKERLVLILTELGYSPDVRGETFSVAEFVRLAATL